MGVTDAREPSKNAVFHGDGFLLSHVVVISMKVTHPPICNQVESSCNPVSYDSVVSMRERDRMCLLGKQLGKGSN